MRLSAVLRAGFVSAIAVALPAQAPRQVTTVVYACLIEGAQAQLIAEVQAVNTAGVFLDARGLFGGSIPTGEVTFYYGGTLVSATGRYSFQGTDQFADFIDLNTNDRFRVQMIVQGQILQMIINPQGPGPVQYFCQMTGMQ